MCWELSGDAGEGGSASSCAQAVTIEYVKNNGYHYHGTMTGLTAGGAYSYVVGTAPTTANFTFTAPNSDPTQPFGVAIYGDMGWLGSKQRPDHIPTGGLVKNWTAVGTRATVEKLKDEKLIDFVWHLGDIAYVMHCGVDPARPTSFECPPGGGGGKSSKRNLHLLVCGFQRKQESPRVQVDTRMCG